MYLGQKVAEKDPNNPHTFKMLMTINQKKRKKKLIFLNKMNFKKKKSTAWYGTVYLEKETNCVGGF